MFKQFFQTETFVRRVHSPSTSCTLCTSGKLRPREATQGQVHVEHGPRAATSVLFTFWRPDARYLSRKKLIKNRYNASILSSQPSLLFFLFGDFLMTRPWKLALTRVDTGHVHRRPRSAGVDACPRQFLGEAGTGSHDAHRYGGAGRGQLICEFG